MFFCFLVEGYQQQQVPNNTKNANINMNVKIAETPAAGTQITEGTPTTVELQEQKGFQQDSSKRMNAKNSKDGITVGRQGITGTPGTSEHWKQRVESCIKHNRNIMDCNISRDNSKSATSLQ
jgi:hypothetical protein